MLLLANPNAQMIYTPDWILWNDLLLDLALDLDLPLLQFFWNFKELPNVAEVQNTDYQGVQGEVQGGCMVVRFSN